jgi:hypothetical protein
LFLRRRIQRVLVLTPVHRVQDDARLRSTQAR